MIKKAFEFALYFLFAVSMVAFFVTLFLRLYSPSEFRMMIISMITVSLGMASCCCAYRTSRSLIVANDKNEASSGIIVGLMGINFKNPNGIPMREITDQLEVGDTVSLRLLSFKDRPSVRVDTNYGSIGYLPRQISYEVSLLIESGTLGRCSIVEMSRGAFGKCNGIKISVEIEEKVITAH